MNYRKEREKALAAAKRKKDLSGSGNYLFENNTNGDFYLPRPTKDGIRLVRKDGQFFGDNYYFSYLKTGELKLVKELNEQSRRKMFVYKNFNRDEVKLPEANRDGQYIIEANGEFVGDERFFPMLKCGKLKLIKELEMTQEKLLTEQPPVITHAGMVEFIKTDEETLTEEQRKKKEQLLAEDPMGGIKLIFD